MATTFMKSTVLLLLIVMGSVFSGCVNLKPKPDSVALYTLGMNTEAVQNIDSSLAAYYVARPEIPGYLRRSAMLYRTESGEVASLSKARWGEDLGEGIARAMAEYLQASGRVRVDSQYPWPKLSNDTREIRILFERFGATDQGKVEVVATWQVRQDRNTIQQGRFQSTDLTWDRNSPATYVAQLNKALEQMAQAIVESI